MNSDRPHEINTLLYIRTCNELYDVVSRDGFYTLFMGTNSPVHIHLQADIPSKVLKILLKTAAAESLTLRKERPDEAFRDLPLQLLL